MAKPHQGRAKKSSSASVVIPKVGIFGATGRMGQEMTQLWIQLFDEPVFLAFGKDGKKEQAKNWVSDFKNPKCKEVEVWIDFSSPQGFDKILSFCIDEHKPLVSGTTGLEKNQFSEMKKAAKNIPVLWAANMSLGVNILLKSLQALSGVSGFDYQIEEAHHRHKKDKPSGTALWIQRELENITKKKIETPLAIRGGGIFGIHKVWAMSDEETITFEHTALNRRVFAKGSIQAALWLSKKVAGLYSVSDMLGS
jgi:4-hydroxy-tetrahydrodipicolinate reductase